MALAHADMFSLNTISDIIVRYKFNKRSKNEPDVLRFPAKKKVDHKTRMEHVH